MLWQPDAIRQALKAYQPSPTTYPSLRSSAVLVPLIPRGDDVEIWLIRRTAHLRTHAGQLALPGGAHEPQDTDLAATALRETAEEIGLPPESVEVLGQLEQVPTNSGYCITPVIGWIADPPALQLQTQEVDEVVVTSLRELLEPQRYGDSWHNWEGRDYRVYTFDIEGGQVWGATSRILLHFLQIVAGYHAGESWLREVTD